MHPVQIAQWKKHALEEMPPLFEGPATRREHADQAIIAPLYQEIGQLKIERDWLRRKGVLPIRRDAD